MKDAVNFDEGSGKVYFGSEVAFFHKSKAMFTMLHIIFPFLLSRNHPPHIRHMKNKREMASIKEIKQ